MLATNQVLNKGRYRIINSFGQDESCGLYQAYDTVSDTNVVLRESVGKLGKVATSSEVEELNAAFVGGAKALKDTKHDSLVSVQDYFSEIDRQYLVLEFLTGDNLTKFLDDGAPRPSLTTSLAWMDHLLDGLSYLHRLSAMAVHGDINPKNIKLTSSMKVKLLTDPVAVFPNSIGTRRFERDGDSEETMNYRPIEQIWTGLDQTSQRVILNSYDEKSAGVLLRAPDARTDIYSIAATFYHLLTGEAPTDALDRSISLLDGRPDTLKRPAEIDESIPPELSDALMRAMSLRRENRFDSATIMQQTLRTTLVRVQERLSGVGSTTIGGITQDQDPVKIENPLASAELELEQERQRTELRHKEIEAEQTKLEEERQQIEQRRKELDAEMQRQEADAVRLSLQAEQEQKRLENERLEQEAANERLRIAQRLAELESKSARERAEEERLEREAQAERLRAEERLNEIHTEQELHRAEQKRIETEARKELELAELRLKELAGQHVAAEPSAVNEGSPYSPEREVSFGFSSFAGDVATPEGKNRTGSNRRMLGIAAGLAVVLGGSLAAWNFLGTRETVPTAISAEQVSPVSIVAQPTEGSQMPAAVEDSTDTLAASDRETAPSVTENDGTTARPVRAQMSAVPERAKKPAPEKQAAPKKKVTVDDLINDN